MTKKPKKIEKKNQVVEIHIYIHQINSSATPPCSNATPPNYTPPYYTTCQSN